MISPATYPGGVDISEMMSERRIDLFVMNMFRSKNFLRVAYEIKVSRSDFFSDVGDMSKHEPIRNFCNEFWFATPRGVVKKEEIPEGCGLMEFDEGSRYAHFIVRPTRKETIAPGWPFIASICRRVQKEEAKQVKLF